MLNSTNVCSIELTGECFNLVIQCLPQLVSLQLAGTASDLCDCELL